MARESKVKKYPVIPNPDLIQAGKGFRPAFGNDEDLRIINRVMELDKKLQLVDNKILRGEDAAKLTSKMRDILREERYLIDSITRRNMDF
jgi:hypothetical protein